MANNVRFTSSFDDKVSSTLDRIHDKFDVLGKSKGAQSILGGVGLGIGVQAFGVLEGAIGRVVDVAEESVHKAIDQQIAMNKLDAALKANVVGWDGNKQAIDKVIESRERLGFTDREQIDSLPILVAGTHNLNKALNLQAVAMDLARFKQISLMDASLALTRVEGGRFKMLASLGIKLKDNATVQEALTAVEKVAAGQSEAYASTTHGAFDRLNAVWDRTEEQLGSALLPVLTDLATTISTNVIPAAETFIKDTQDVLGPVAKLNDALHDQGGILGTYAKAYEALSGPLKNAGEAFFEIGYAMDDLSGKAHSSEDSTRHAADSIGVSVDELKTKFEQTKGAVTAWAHEGERAGEGMSRALVSALPAITAAAGDDARVLANQIASQDANVRKEAYESALAAASGLIAGQKDVESGAASLAEALKNQISGSKRIANIEGVLAGQALADALKSKDPLVRAQARLYRQSLEDQLASLAADSAAWGNAIGSSWIRGISQGINTHYHLLTHELNRVAGDMKGKSPPKTGPLRDLDKGAARIAASWVESFAGTLEGAQGQVRQALGGINLGVGGGMAAAGGAGSGRSIVVNFNSVWPPTPTQAREIAAVIDRESYYGISRASPSAVRK